MEGQSRTADRAAWRAGRSLAIAIGGAVLGLSIAAAQSEPPVSKQRNPYPPSADSIARGRGIYVKHCASCHGPAGRGDGKAAPDLDPPPTDLSGSQVVHKTDWELFRNITRGRRTMPSFRRSLPDEDRWHVINYIRTFAAAHEDRPSDEK